MDFQSVENGYAYPNYENNSISKPPKRRCFGLTPLSIAFCIICSICTAAVILGIVLGLIPVYLAAINSKIVCFFSHCFY